MGGTERAADQPRDHVPHVPAASLDTKKKSLQAAERDEAARAAFRELIAALDARRLVVVDEMGSNLALSPLYARAPRGQRAYSSVPRNHGKNTTLLAALTLEGIGPALTLQGAVDTPTFVTYVRELLGPALRPGQIVLLDNLSCHADPHVRALIEACGCQVLYLPSYSPDFSPLEKAFAKIKQYLRRVAARTPDALEAALAQALDLISAQDAHNFFRHCGYHLVDQSL
jgi:transposase